MSEAQKERQHELMNMHPSQWPDGLKKTMDAVIKKTGASGGVISDVIELWLESIEHTAFTAEELRGKQ